MRAGDGACAAGSRGACDNLIRDIVFEPPRRSILRREESFTLNPESRDRWSAYRVRRRELPSRIVRILEELERLTE